ncbi:hypothetical protein DEU56DRAFT_789030 [Suillus clintonianus]|uniref:uncharacterized protein n=1 Tax=Suillus clintonianus TaxID=1904413 RepID=UPI001B880576|nr:uncharacterized protein DEU56DRAFT_789030 [Suillus clintonianus]KAG2145135.1 hypothetical protein DEU56DRAFT_789030 [Suillus clintonianus]
MENTAITHRVNQGNFSLSLTRHSSRYSPHKYSFSLSPSASLTISPPYHNLSDLRTRNNYLSMQLHSHSYDPFDLSGFDVGMNREDSSHPLYPPCSHCPQGSMNQCKEAACPILEMTSQCTDQCVVVACNDPTHPEPSCHVADDDIICDSPCLPNEDCVDCSGLEELLKCCTDYHSYLSQPKSLDPSLTQSNWNPQSADDFCGCDETDYGEQHISQFLSEHSGIAGPLGDVSPEHPVSSSSAFSASPISQAATQFTPVSLPQNLPQMYNCLWADCKATFPTITELVGHVNLDHLRPQNLTKESASQQVCSNVPRNQHFEPNALSCHWGDCAMYPSPESISSSSTTAFTDTVLNVLTTHLMQDHLGINYPFLQSTTVHTAPPQKIPPTCMENIAHDESPADAPSDPSPRKSCPPDSPSTDYAIKPCQWSGCTQTFSSPDDLTKHILAAHIGSGKAHYECCWEGCSRNGTQGFSSKQKVARHMQSHTGHRPFKCKVCNAHFSETATLQQHMRRHTQEKPYVCDFPGCGKAFAITGALTIHKRTHNGVKPFKCKYCEKAFTESSNLSKHLRTHTGARPYPCPEDGCGKSFARPDQLARHMSVHRKKDSVGLGVL